MKYEQISAVTVPGSVVRTCVLAALLAGHWSSACAGELTAEEKALLGTTLTEIGAEKAANQDGTIEAFEWGKYKIPAAYEMGSGSRVDVIEGESPRLSIDAGNMAEHTDKLTEGTKAMLAKYSSTFRLDVYPTHRTVSFPDWLLKRTKELAGTATLSADGVALSNIHAAVPFPIPKTGIEAVWNHLTRFEGVRLNGRYTNHNVDASGKSTISTGAIIDQQYPYWDQSKDKVNNYFVFKIFYFAPPRRNGEIILGLDPFDFSKQGRRVLQYLPGQRRVKLAPELSFDTPNPGTGGVANWDDGWMFNGSPERFDWELKGKKEMYVMYNNCTVQFKKPPAELVGKDHLNPDKVRWELHRVWLVEGKLKQGKRHNYHRRLFYLDEDSWSIVASDSFDARGELYRTNLALGCALYDAGSPNAAVFFSGTEAHMDLIADNWTMQALPGPDGYWKMYPDLLPDNEFTADAIAGSGLR